MADGSKTVNLINQQKSTIHGSEKNLICQKSIGDNPVQLERSDFQNFGCKTMTATKQMHQQQQQQHENVSDKLNNVSTCGGSRCNGSFVKSFNENKNDSGIITATTTQCIDRKSIVNGGVSGALNASASSGGKVFKKILPKNNSNKNNNTKIGLTTTPATTTTKTMATTTSTILNATTTTLVNNKVTPDTNTIATTTTLTTTVDSSAIIATPSVNVKKMDKTKMGTETGTPGTETCHERDDDSRMKKKRCTDRYDSSESSDSGVATLSCTDSSTASSDASDPGSPYSPGSIGEDTHQSSKTNMPPQIIQAAQLQQQHQTNSVKSQWPWNTSKTVVNNNNNNNVKSNHNNNLTTTVNNNTNIGVTTTNNKLKRISSQTTGDIVGTPKKLRTTANNNASEKFTTTASNNNNIITNAKRLKTTSTTAPDETQQTKITGYFKSQMKPLNGLKREISNLVARSIDTQSVNGGLDKFFILAKKSKDEKDQSIANGIKKDYELDVRTLTTTTVSSLKKLERKTTKIAHVAPTTRKNSNAHIKTTLSASNLNETKSPKKHVAIAPRTSDIKKTANTTNTLRKSLMTSAAKQIENCKNSQPTVLLTAIRIPVSHHQTTTNGQTKIAPKPSPSTVAGQQSTNMSATSSQGLTTSPPTKVNSVFQIPVMPNLVQIPNIITANRANLVVNNNGQLARVGNGTQYFLNGTVIKVQQIGSTTTAAAAATATNGVQNLGHMDNSLTGNILVKQQATIAQTVPFSSTSIGGGTTTTKGTLQSLTISNQTALTSTCQTAITSATQFQQNGNNQRLQTQPSVFMATSGGLLLNATLPAVISTSKLPGLTQALPALHPIQQTTQNANILPSINTLLQPHHHHHHHHSTLLAQQNIHHSATAATNSLSSQQFIVSQSSHHQSLVNMSPIATLSPITRSQQNFQLSDVVTSKLSEPPSLRLITNCCTNDSITSTSSLTTTTTTTATSTTFTPTLTSWSKQIAETIQNDSDKTIRRDSFLGGRTSLSIREPTLPPLLPLTLPSISSSSSSSSSSTISTISTSVVSLSNKCESRLSTDIENVKSPPSEPSEDTSEPSIPSSELSNQSVLSSTDENSTSTIRDEVAKVCLPSAKNFKIEEIQKKTLPDVFIDDDEEVSTEKLQIKSSSIQDIVSNGNGYKESTIVEVDIELVNNHKTTKECAISPILSQPKTIRFPALKSDSNFRFGPKGTKRHDGVCYWDHCNQKYDTCSKLLDHLQTTHVNTQTGPFSCLWSGCKVHSRESCSRRWLERHVLSHGGTKPFKCIVDGCGLRFGSQLALQKHVNGHFNTTESKDNSNKKASDPPVPKQLRKNGKKLRYRRQPFSARLFDFFDSGIMEGLQHRLMVTGSLASGPKGSITFHGRTMARRVTFEGKPEVFVRWNPSDIIADEWIPEKQGILTKMVTIHSMRSQELIALQKYLGIAYNNSDIKKVFKDEETSLAVSLNNSFTRINSRKHSRKPPKQNTQPS